MTTIQTKRGTKVRTQSNRRFVLLAETVGAVRAGLEIRETGEVSNAHIVKRSDSRETLEKHVQRVAEGLRLGRQAFTEYTIVDTKDSS